MGCVLKNLTLPDGRTLTLDGRIFDEKEPHVNNWDWADPMMTVTDRQFWRGVVSRMREPVVLP